MIPKECKRLIEVDFPVAQVSAHATREKPIVHHHPQSLSQWWARRPLAACRAVLLGLLLPDPCDEHCPKDFKAKARKLLPFKVGQDDVALRKALLRFIADFANWDMASNATFLEAGRGLVKAAHPGETPLVVDPFAGGGAIPLEALRLGCEAFASDLNPVACLILKAMLEDIPKHGPKLAEELRKVGAEIKAKAEKELAEFYPKDPDGSTPIAYLWARTVRCEASECGAEIPLVRSFWVCKKPNRKRALRHHVVRPRKGASRVEFETFEPKSDKDVPPGTVSRAKAKCISCGQVLHPDRVRAQLSAQRGGADVVFDKDGDRIGGARLLLVVTLRPGRQGRCYRLPTARDYEAIWKASKLATRLAKKTTHHHMRAIPDEPTPAGGGSGAGRAFSVQNYGMMAMGDLFTARQKLGLATFSRLTSERLTHEGGLDVVAFCVARLADRDASLVGWDVSGEKLGHVFNRQALPIVWDFAEVSPCAGASGGYDSIVGQISAAVEHIASSSKGAGSARQADARISPLSDESCSVWFTDPPYYDAVPYADLSDFFLVWLKRCIPGYTPQAGLLDRKTGLSPKVQEIVQDETKSGETGPHDGLYFESSMADAFKESRRILAPGGIGCVVFAHKSTEGWEALLGGMIGGGLTVTASWPIATERAGRLRSRDSAALAASVHLVCRPRAKSAGVGDWGEVLVEMQKRVKSWMVRLREEKIRGADAIFSCIGPALESYSRYERVETPAGRSVPLGGDPEADRPEKRGFLAYVFEVVSKEALRQVLGDAETEGFEEDARLTALFLWTLQSTKVNGLGGSAVAEEDEDADAASEDAGAKPTKAAGGFSMPFDTFIRITRPMGIHYQNWERRVVEIEKGVVTLRPVVERSEELLGTAAGGDARVFMPPEQQMKLFGKEEVQRQVVVAKRGIAGRVEKQTALDRLHVAMLLFRAGQTTLLKQVLEEERKKGARFERLALALTALYPEKSEERRLLEGVQAVMGR